MTDHYSFQREFDRKKLEGEDDMRLTEFLQIIKDQMNVEDVYPHQRFKEDLGADSLDMVELLTTLEDTTEIEFPDMMEAENSVLVGDLFISMMKIIHATKVYNHGV